MGNLWGKIKVGNMELPHRLALAPMTRSRAHTDGTPSDLAVEYYSQRASLGLLISEGTQPSEDGQGYLNTPGIYNENHIKGWEKVSDKVHENGGYLFIQLMHVGRMSHPDNTPHHRKALAPSPIAAEEKIFTSKGLLDIPAPREIQTDEIARLIEEFRHAAASAIQAGADGVEIHGANGYLLHQFFGENTNQRTDAYGGSIENKARFAIEVTKAVVDEIGADKVGFRISPGAPLGGVREGEPGNRLYEYLVAELNKLELAYLHVMHLGNEQLLKSVREKWSGILLVNRAGRALEDISIDLYQNLADVIPVGSWAIANPDLVVRLKKEKIKLNEINKDTIYGGGAEGYVDYPFLQ
ncbi:2,4-dienoyl-CoA reductase-like NADH-dependent reductase (Old Yellow Enzyme family) [Trichococcus patagoniensis]|uniref:2,4-dienoyl-CoA reductase-like NADH-dependent reductase (Old Yellow Enzyme family) n=1 Tax=Trichococcus patagoniensis TaxID=382641 RepID=A0A2T5IKF9_9LACT|nr:alkene reductase [Trichococcus patagoniensis]PTQ84293.1 2,4-dienoyl-CoA reductase-like NADH-dependent reductase (Old Yellow Enzyme family) [Trichococcus patagoniensis]